MEIYKLVHLVAIMALFVSFGAAIVADMIAERIKFRWIALLHGIALFVILVTGFGMLSTLGIHGALPGWAIAKVTIWLTFGLSLILAKRKLLPKSLLISFLLLLGAGAAFCALWKP